MLSRHLLRNSKFSYNQSSTVCFNEFSMTISVENDIIFVNESSQSSQVDYSFEKLRIVSNTYVENTEKKIYSQTNSRNEIIFTSNIYAKDLAQTQISNAFEIQSSYMLTKFSTFNFTSNFLFFQFVWRNSRISRIRMRNLIDVFAFESSKTKRDKRDKNVQFQMCLRFNHRTCQQSSIHLTSRVIFYLFNLFEETLEYFEFEWEI